MRSRPVSQRDLDLGHEELQTFRTVGDRLDRGVRGDAEAEEVEVIRIGGGIPEEERSELEFEVRS